MERTAARASRLQSAIQQVANLRYGMAGIVAPTGSRLYRRLATGGILQSHRAPN